MDAIELLTGDHNRVRGLFAQFETAEEADDTATMSTVATKILDDLEAHTTIEEEIFYPAIHDETKEISDVVDEGVEEHHVVKVLMSEVRDLDPSDDAWKAKMKVIIEGVEHHAKEEEEEMFPAVRKNTAKGTLEDLAVQMESRKAALGAPVTAHAEGMTKAALLDLAKEQEIPGRSTMSQDELTRTVDARS